MRVKVLRNVKKSWTKEVEEELSSFLKSKNILVVKEDADVTICIGGDGTIFYFNHIKELEGAVLGIGTGTSHLCCLRLDNWKEDLISLLKENKTESRITLSAKIGTKRFSAINDVVLHTIDYRVILTTIEANNSKNSFEGDGIIIATPTGSTAYAYSAGGLIIDKEVEAIEVVPICPYKKLIAPTIIHENSKISIHADRTSDLTIDGIFIKKLNSNERVFIEKGSKILFLV